MNKSHLQRDTTGRQLSLLLLLALAFAVLLLAAAPVAAQEPAGPVSVSAWSNWTSLGKPPSGVYLTAPAIGRNANGRISIFAKDIGSASKQVWYKTQPSASCFGGSWASLGNPGVNVYSPSVGTNADGRLELFTTDANGNPYHKPQTSANGSFSSIWEAWSRPSDNAQVFFPFPSHNQDGRMEVFFYASDNTIRHMWQTAPNNGWNSWWGNMSKPTGASLNGPVATTHLDGRMAVFTIDSNTGQVVTKSQGSVNGPFQPDWDNLGGPSQTVWAQSLSIGTNADGRLELLAVANDGALWHKWQTSPNSGPYVASWASFGKPTSQFLTEVAATKDSQGRIVAFARTQTGAIYMISQTAPNSGWNSWVALGNPSGASARDQIAAGQNSNGQPIVVVAGSDGNIWYRKQLPAVQTIVLQQGLSGYLGAKDTFINANAPNINYGLNQTIGVQANDKYASLLYFNLTGKLPACSSIVSAGLSVYISKQVPTGAHASVTPYRLLRAWTDTQATWNKATSTVNWGTPGANNTTSDHVASTPGTVSWNAVGWRSTPVTSIVQTWASNSSSNKGLVLKATGTAGQTLQFASSNHPNISLRPKLIISYQPP